MVVLSLYSYFPVTVVKQTFQVGTLEPFSAQRYNFQGPETVWEYIF